MTDEIVWSDWLDTNSEQSPDLPESPGVFMMHAAMKILHIGGSSNIRNSLQELFKKECTCDAKRFRYALTKDFEQTSAALLSEYQGKHDGKLPRCM